MGDLPRIRPRSTEQGRDALSKRRKALRFCAPLKAMSSYADQYRWYNLVMAGVRQDRVMTRLASNIPSSRSGNHLKCPSCSSRRSYKLGDGRRRCRRCRKRFTPHPNRDRLSKQQIAEIVHHFWTGTKMGTVARKMSLDRKTVRQRYWWIRESIARENDAALATLLRVTLPSREPLRTPSNLLFGVIESVERLYLVLPESGLFSTAWNRANAKAFITGGDPSKSPDGVRWTLRPGVRRGGRRVSYKPVPPLCGIFSDYALKRLARIRTGDRHSFGLHLHEALYRFNYSPGLWKPGPTPQKLLDSTKKRRTRNLPKPFRPSS